MTVSAGTRLGPYEVLAPLGAGGMGEVYQARDTRLGRDVAIKVLPAELSGDADRLKRFDTEARAASALNHPNIVTIHDIGTAESLSYIAMEFVEGKTLREVLAGGLLPVRKLLQIASQIAAGLARAHSAGIVHRDLKPENVMVTKDGLVKILDFGLAKLAHPELESNLHAEAPTVSEGTRPGMVMGTVGYMSPEQASGHPVDVHSDQFSLGSILYEMATGKRPFQRASVPQTLTAIIQDEPDPIASLNSKVPAPLRWITERCLSKDPQSRYASTEDLARELGTVRDRLAETSSGEEVSASPRTPGRRLARRIGTAVGAALLLTLAAIAWHLRQSDYFWKNPLAGARFTLLTDWDSSELDASISADGKFVAFLSDRDRLFDAWMTQVGSGEFLNLTKGQFPNLLVEEVRNVGFSDDGTNVWLKVPGKDPHGAVRTTSVWFVPTMGGVPRPFLAKGTLVVWSADRSQIVYHTAEPGDPIFVADRNGANPRQILIERPGIHNHYPTWSPSGRFVYFVQGIPGTYDMDVWRIPSKGGKPERITRHHGRIAYPTLLDERTLIYTAAGPDSSASALYSMDVERRIVHRLSFGLEEYISIAASSDTSRLVATVANRTRSLWTVPISEKIAEESEASPVHLPAAYVGAPRFGPDYLLYLSSKGTQDGLWKSKDSQVMELWKPTEGAVVAAPAISSDGAQIALVVRNGEKSRLFMMQADGTSARLVAESLDARGSASWSPDGKWIAVCASEDKAQPLFKVPVDGGAPIRLVDGVIYNPVWSPDGRFLVYTEGLGAASYPIKAITAEGKPYPLTEVFVRFAGDRYRFLPDGTGLVIVQGAVRQENFWVLNLMDGKLRQLTNLRPGFEIKSFDISPDRKRILFDRSRENSDIVLIELPSH